MLRRSFRLLDIHPPIRGGRVIPESEFGRRAFLVSLVAVLGAAAVAVLPDGPEPSDDQVPTDGSDLDQSAIGDDALLQTEPPSPEPPTPEPTPAPTPEPEGPYPFALGVASGDPDERSVVLWTRLIVEPLTGTGMGEEVVDVLWEAATDREFAGVIASGIIDARPEFGHSVHVVAPLPADTWVWYRFTVRGHLSPVGRTRSFPAPDVPAPPLRFGVSSCQNLEHGHYAAHRALAESADDLDAFVFLGDYIYEYGRGTAAIDATRAHASAEVTNLNAYRNRYGQYRSDPHLQAHHAARPWIVTWDDHEVDNDYAGDTSQDDDDVEAFRTRRAAAYQAWWEHMPVRLPPPAGPDYRIHRNIRWGDLATFMVLDGRQYRADQPSDGEFRRIPVIAETEASPIRAIGPTAMDPDHSMLGAEQEQWLIDSAAASQTAWNIIAQQVMMHGLAILPGADPPVTPTDTWDGYAGNRARLLSALDEKSGANLVVLTGDFHMGSVGDLKPDPFDTDSPIVATELMAPSISSRFVADASGLVDLLVAFNPQIRHVQTANGYLTCEVTADDLTARFHTVLDPADPDSEVAESAAFRITAGTPGADALEG